MKKHLSVLLVFMVRSYAMDFIEDTLNPEEKLQIKISNQNTTAD